LDVQWEHGTEQFCSRCRTELALLQRLPLLLYGSCEITFPLTSTVPLLWRDQHLTQCGNQIEGYDRRSFVGLIDDGLMNETDWEMTFSSLEGRNTTCYVTTWFTALSLSNSSN
jgi:hypothetical protein